MKKDPKCHVIDDKILIAIAFHLLVQKMRIWHEIKNHLGLFSTHPFNYCVFAGIYNRFITTQKLWIFESNIVIIKCSLAFTCLSLARDCSSSSSCSALIWTLSLAEKCIVITGLLHESIYVKAQQQQQLHCTPATDFFQMVGQWDFQNKGRSRWTGTSCFFLELQLSNLITSICVNLYHVTRSCKGPINGSNILQTGTRSKHVSLDLLLSVGFWQVQCVVCYMKITLL